MESEAKHPFRSWLCHLWFSENYMVWVRSRRRRINQSQFLILGLVIGLFFHFFWLLQSSFHWITSNWVVNGIRRNGNILILPTPIPLSLWLCLRGRKLSFHSHYDSILTLSQVKINQLSDIIPPSSMFSTLINLLIPSENIPLQVNQSSF